MTTRRIKTGAGPAVGPHCAAQWRLLAEARAALATARGAALDALRAGGARADGDGALRAALAAAEAATAALSRYDTPASAPRPAHAAGPLARAAALTEAARVLDAALTAARHGADAEPRR